MNPYLLLAGIAIFTSGYWLGRENTIKLCRRLYKLDVDLDMVFIEHAERDTMFNKNIQNRVTLRQIR